MRVAPTQVDMADLLAFAETLVSEDADDVVQDALIATLGKGESLGYVLGAVRRIAADTRRSRAADARRVEAMGPCLVAEGEPLYVSMGRCKRTPHGKIGTGKGSVLGTLPCPECGVQFKPSLIRDKRKATCGVVACRVAHQRKARSCGIPT